MEFDLDFPLLCAGAIGGLASLITTKPKNKLAWVSGILVGAAFAMFVTPLILQLIKMPDASTQIQQGLGFILGLGSKEATEFVVKGKLRKKVLPTKGDDDV